MSPYVHTALRASPTTTARPHVPRPQVFRRLYEAVGLGWVYAITKWVPDSSLYIQ